MTWVDRKWCFAFSVFISFAHGTCSGQEERPRPTERERLRDIAHKAELDKTRAVVRGRCVDAATGEPLAGCKVHLRSQGRGGPPTFMQELDRSEPWTTVADGRFSGRILAREHCWVDLEITHEGRWPRTARWYSMEPGRTYDVGTVRLHPGVHACGKVVNDKGEPMPKIHVSIQGLTLSIAFDRGKWDPNNRTVRMDGVTWRYQISGVDGVFESEDALPPGPYVLNVANRGFELLRPMMITIPDKGPMRPIDIVVKELPFIAGVVVDETGRPFPNVGLTPGHAHPGSGRTDEVGRFRVYRIGKLPDKVRLTVSTAGSYEPGTPTAEYTWGTVGVKIVLQQTLTLKVTVVEAGSTKPVEHFSIRCYPTQGLHGTPWTQLRHSGYHPGGKLVVEGVRRGAGRLAIVPKDPRLLPRTLELFGDKTMEPLRVEVQRLVPMQVHVQLKGDRPAANVKVQVITPGNRRDSKGFVGDPRAVFLQGFSGDPNVRFNTEIYKATTGALGKCIVYGVDGRDDLILRLSFGRKEQRVSDVAFGRAHLSRRVTFID